MFILYPLFLCLTLQSIANAVGIPLQMVLPAAESINGSSNDIGCSPDQLNITDKATICGSLGHGSISHLIDGVSPDIDTSNNTWASQLVTVKKGEANIYIIADHVLLTFLFDTPVSVTRIEIDLFNCPDWNIGAPDVIVYLFENYTIPLRTRDQSGLVVVRGQLSNPSCDSLSTVTMTGGVLQAGSLQTFHILITFASDSPIDYVYVGEVKFFNTAGNIITFQDSMMETTTSILSSDSTTSRPQSTSVVENMENRCTCSEESSCNSALIGVSAVSLLLIVILSTVILVQCLLIIRMRRSSNTNETYTETTNPITNTTTTTTDVPVSHNEAYALTKITNPREEVTYELVK